VESGSESDCGSTKGCLLRQMFEMKVILCVPHGASAEMQTNITGNFILCGQRALIK